MYCTEWEKSAKSRETLTNKQGSIVLQSICRLYKADIECRSLSNIKPHWESDEISPVNPFKCWFIIMIGQFSTVWTFVDEEMRSLLTNPFTPPQPIKFSFGGWPSLTDWLSCPIYGFKNAEFFFFFLKFFICAFWLNF